MKDWSSTVVNAAASISSLVMGLNSLASIGKTAMNPDLSGWEKFTSIAMSLGMGLPMILNSLIGLNKTFGLLAGF
jgi:hypothetical protein